MKHARHSGSPSDYSAFDERKVVHLWLARGVFLRDYPQSLVADFRFYRPDIGSPPGWELVGTINKDILVATTTGEVRDMIFPLKAPLGGTVATLMAVPYVDMSAWSPPRDPFGRDGYDYPNSTGEYSVSYTPRTSLRDIRLLG